MSRHQILSSTKSIVSTITRLRRSHFWPAALLLILGLAVIFGSEPRVAGLGGSSIFRSATRAQDGRQDPPPASNPATIPSETQQACGLDCNATVPATGSVGVGVNFQGSATATNCSTAPSYSWTFGDGGTSTQQNPSHTYNGTGTFNWSMTVTASGSGGGSSAISTIAGGEGEGLTASQVSFNRLNSVVRDPQGRGIYLGANNLSSRLYGDYIYFINTSNAPVTIAGKTFAPGVARIIAGGGQFTDDNIAA